MFCIHLHIFMWHLEPSSSLWDGVHIDVCLAPVTSYSTALWMQPGRADFWIHQSKRMWCLNDNSWLSDPGINIIMFHMWGSTFTKKKMRAGVGSQVKRLVPIDGMQRGTGSPAHDNKVHLVCPPGLVLYPIAVGPPTHSYEGSVIV